MRYTMYLFFMIGTVAQAAIVVSNVKVPMLKEDARPSVTMENLDAHLKKQIVQLGDDNYYKREAAQKELGERLPTLTEKFRKLPELIEAAVKTEADAERRYRLQRILKPIRIAEISNRIDRKKLYESLLEIVGGDSTQENKDKVKSLMEQILAKVAESGIQTLNINQWWDKPWEVQTYGAMVLPADKFPFEVGDSDPIDDSKRLTPAEEDAPRGKTIKALPRAADHK